jgi:hypothetical protein
MDDWISVGAPEPPEPVAPVAPVVPTPAPPAPTHAPPVAPVVTVAPPVAPSDQAGPVKPSPSAPLPPPTLPSARAVPDDIVTGVATAVLVMMLAVIGAAYWHTCVESESPMWLELRLAGGFMCHTAVRSALDAWVWTCTAPRPTLPQQLIDRADEAFDRLADRACASGLRAWRRACRACRECRACQLFGTIDWDEHVA